MRQNGAVIVVDVLRGSGDSHIGLKLGKRIYFEDASCVGAVKAATTHASVFPGSSVPPKKSRALTQGTPIPRCQVEGCKTELSSAVYIDGELVVTVPKDVADSATGEEDNGLSVESKGEDLGEDGVNSETKMDPDDGNGHSENRDEEGSRRVQSEGQSLYENGVTLNHGMHTLIPKQNSLIRTVSLVTKAMISKLKD